MDHLKEAAQDFKFESTLKPRLDVAEQDWHATQPPATPTPEIIEYPVDSKLQTGESAKLGGAMEIKSPWERS